jgi:hypothetical protein
VREWARQTVFFALNERTYSVSAEVLEQMGIRAETVAGRVLTEAEKECAGDQAQVIRRVSKGVFDWVAEYRASRRPS